MSLTLLQGYSSAEEGEDADERDYESSGEEGENRGVERYGSSSSVFDFSASNSAKDSGLPSANDVFSQVHHQISTSPCVDSK